MITKLVEALQGLDPRPTPEEIADALWLAGRFGLRDPEATPAFSGPAPEHSVGEAAEPVDPGRSATPETTAPAEGNPRPVEAGLFLTDGMSAPARTVRAPAPSAISQKLRVSRALRPLRVRRDSVTEHYLDEVKTARQVAETGVWEPRMTPTPERWLDLALVVDTSTSMIVWRQLAVEFQALLERLGAFRDVRTWRLNTDGDRLLEPTSGSGPRRSPTELVDPTRRRVVLLVSDCIGGAWQDGRAAELLDVWGRSGPVCIVQPLPERLWWRCAASVTPVRFSASAPALPNAMLDVRPTGGLERPPGIAIPVLEMDPRWLGPWAAMVASGRRDVYGAAIFTERAVTEQAPLVEAAGTTPLDRVMRFRATASPNAYQLAGYLAAAPLRLPVMRLVQQAMLPESTPADLAEIYLSGLLRVTDDRPSGVNSYELTYDFLPGVRSVLLGGLRRGEALRVLREVWNVVREQFGSPLDFPALLGAIHENRPGLPPDRPFAQVTAEVLGRLGGRYGDIAKKLVSEPEATPPLVPPRPNSETNPHRSPLWGPFPARNPDFTGRDDLLESLAASLRHGPTTLLPHPLHGLGGEGKSQLAVEYAHRYAAEYDLVWWILADQMTLARSALTDLARQLGTPHSDNIKGVVENLRRAMRDSDHPRWLLIFDNARDPEQLLPVLPLAEHASCHLVFTSRDRRWEGLTNTLDVDVFERPESITHLRRRVSSLSAEEADELAGRLGDLPLAVAQAAAWQTTTDRSAAEYLRLFDRQLRSVSDRPLPQSFPAHLAASSGMIFDRLREESPDALRLFDLWAYFGPEPVTAQLLSYGRHTTLPEPLAGVLADDDILTETMSVIGRYALARFDPAARSLHVHRLVRTMLQTRLSESERHKVRANVHAILAAATPGVESDRDNTWEQRALVTPHVRPSGVLTENSEAALRVAIDQAGYLYQSGDFAGARSIAEAKHAQLKEQPTADPAQTLEVARILANALRGLGNFRAAAQLSKDTLDRSRREFGLDDLTTLLTASGYGADLKSLGDFRQAFELQQDTWLRMRRIYTSSGAEAILASSNHGHSLRLLGRFSEAFEVDKDALEALRRSDETNYRAEFRVTHHVGRDLHGLGRYSEALALQRDSLTTLAPVLSPSHSLVLQAQMSHAGTLRQSGQTAEAEELAIETFDAHRNRFGDKHPNTLASKVCMALARIARGNADDARQLLVETSDGLRTVLGADHPFTHACAASLGIALRASGDVQVAFETDRAAEEALARSDLGPDHYYTLCMSAGLSSDLYLLGELEAAEARCGHTVERMRMQFGPDHPHTLACAHNLWVIRQALGTADAPNEPLARLRGILGALHPAVLTASRGDLLECVIEPMPL